MKSKSTTKKQAVIVKDLSAKKNPKGGGSAGFLKIEIVNPGISDQAAAGGLISYRGR